ncbi:MAG: thioether cross-link-forming SCIFF peptide maturase [Eubacteriales bacterium]|nr:thioether cross-link-forming SCIFF peptide maturase [Eubacteriales bacterium]
MVHHYRMHDTNIVLDVNSGAVFQFDDTAYEVLKLYIKSRDEDSNIASISDIRDLKMLRSFSCRDIDEKILNESINEIGELEKEGLLFSPEGDIEAALEKLGTGVIKSMCINIAHDCNMRCGYCFASTGSFGHGRLLMDKETGFRAIDYLTANSGSRVNLEVDFFGGEPLMNFDAIVEIINYARSIEKTKNKHFRFTITTNGLALDEAKMTKINELFDNVVLSLDGTEKTNDRMRKLPNGGGSYKHIMPKIKKMCEIRGERDHYVRGTFTAYNIQFSKDVLHLADLGFKSISLEPVVTDKKNVYAIKEEHLDELYNEYEWLAKEYLNRKNKKNSFRYFHFNIDLENGPCLAKRVKGCGAGYEYVAVTPEGDIYPCHQFVGKKEFILGNLYKEGFKKEIAEKFKSSNITTKEICRNCWAKFFCSGGCAANAFEQNGDISIPYDISCKLQKKRIECAIWLKTMGM